MKTRCQVLLLLASTACQTPPSTSRRPEQGSRKPAVLAASAARGAPSVAVPTPARTLCGNAKVEEGERCDDGNTNGGDGCSGHCRREPVRFFSWNYVALADGSVVSRQTGEALPGRLTLAAPEAALIQTEDGLRYFYGADRLHPLPSDARVASLGAGRSPCLLNDRGEVWCVSGIMSSWERPHFERGPHATEGDLTLIWNKLRRAAGPVTGLAGNINIGCILLDGGTTLQCWRGEIVHPGSSLSPKMPLGRGHIAKQIVAGGEHFCVLLESGEVGAGGIRASAKRARWLRTYREPGRSWECQSEIAERLPPSS